MAREMAADLVIVGGGTGGCAAALAALRNGLTVVMTEETDWIGGQFTQQAVPPDEHPWIESFGYRLHPVELDIGEAAGALAACCLAEKETPRGVRNSETKLGACQKALIDQGVEVTWPRLTPR